MTGLGQKSSYPEKIRNFQGDGVAAHPAEELVPLTLLERKLDDVPGPEVIPDEKIEAVLFFPGLPEQPGVEKEAAGDLVVEGRLIGQPVEDLLSGAVDGLTDPVSLERPFQIAARPQRQLALDSDLGAGDDGGEFLVVDAAFFPFSFEADLFQEAAALPVEVNVAAVSFDEVRRPGELAALVDDLIPALAKLEAAVDFDTVEEFRPDEEVQVISVQASAGILANATADVHAEALEDSLVIAPGVAGHEVEGLDVDLVDKARPDGDVVLDPLEARPDLQAGVRLPLELEEVDTVPRA